MGSDLVIIVFAIVVIGGLGSIFGSAVTGLGLGVIEGLTKVCFSRLRRSWYSCPWRWCCCCGPLACSGGRTRDVQRLPARSSRQFSWCFSSCPSFRISSIPVFVMKVLCFALFACAFNLLLDMRALSRLVTRPFSVHRVHHRLVVREMALTPEIGIVAGAAVAACSGLHVRRARNSAAGHLPRHDHASLAQLVYFTFLQAPFTGAEDGMQPDSARPLAWPHRFPERL